MTPWGRDGSPAGARFRCTVPPGGTAWPFESSTTSSCVRSTSRRRAGWIWRGIVPWDKGEGSRVLPDGFRTQCEYIVWASTGPLPVPHPGVLAHPGCFHFPVLQSDKHHQTGKPTPLMREVVKIAKPGGVILDPFAGSGTTLAVAERLGRDSIGIELNPAYIAMAERRIRAVDPTATVELGNGQQQKSLFGPNP